MSKMEETIDVRDHVSNRYGSYVAVDGKLVLALKLQQIKIEKTWRMLEILHGGCRPSGERPTDTDIAPSLICI